MNTDQAYYIEQLISEKIAGIISASDEFYLDELIESDPAIAKLWSDTLAKYTEEDLKSDFSKFDGKTWEPPIDVQNSLETRRINWQIWTAAAAIIGVVVSLAIWRYTIEKPGSNVITKSRDVQLTLSNGKVISLSAQPITVQLPDATLKNAGTTLSFNVAPSTSPKAVGPNTLTVPNGLLYSVTLSDGSEIMLNSESSLVFPFSFGSKREITLSGQAYIKVAKDAEKPFIIHTGVGEIEVLGTEFDVNCYKGEVAKVSLVSGAIKVLSGNDSQVLQPGIQSCIDSLGSMRTRPFDDQELSWRTGQYYFASSKLSDISKVISRWFGLEIKIDNQEVASRLFTGRIERDIPITNFLEDLKATTSINYYFSPDSVLHFK